MRFCWFTDVHVSDNPPSMREDSYSEDIFDKIREIADVCRKVKADYAIFGGDWFHSKIAFRVSHNLVNESLEVLDEFPCPIIWIVGSHDVPYGRLDLMYKRPIGTLLRHPKVIYIDDVYTLQVSDSLVIRMFPVSDSYNNTTEEVVKAIEDMKMASFNQDYVTGGGKYYDIALLHQPVVKEGTFPYNVVQAGDLLGMADLVIWGHMHNYDGVWTWSTETIEDMGEVTTTFANVGSVSRGSMDEKTFNRKPMILLFAVSEEGKLSYKEYALKSAKPATAVFKVADKQEQVAREADIEALLNNVKETKFGLFSKEAAIEKIRLKEYHYNVDLTEEENTKAQARFEAVKATAVEILEGL